MEKLALVLEILTGIIAMIPFIISLVAFFKTVIKNKNWKAIVALVMKLVVEAEENFKDGAEKKKYVIDSVKAFAETINYQINEEELTKLIEDIIKITKKVNVQA